MKDDPLTRAWALVRKYLPHAVTALVAVAATLGLTVVIDHSDNGPGTPHHTTVTVKVNQAPDDGHPTATITASQATVDNLADQATNLHEESPAGTTGEDRAAIRKAADHIRATQPPLPTAGASAGFEGCRTELVRNQSSRGSIRPQQIWDHYTVSHNVPGWADVNAVVALFDRSSAQASSNFVIDAEGHCAYIVPIEAKAWAQAAANPFAISIEVIDYGTESTYLPPAGMAKLRSVTKQIHDRTGIPLRRGKVVNCTPAVSGIVQHLDGGLCAGGHHDIAPFDIDAVVKQQIAGAVKPVSAHARRVCQELNGLRRVKSRTSVQGARAQKLKKALAKSYVCAVGPPGKITRR